MNWLQNHVYKFKKFIGRTDFSDQSRKVICYTHIGDGLHALVINPITVDNFTALFNCTPVDRASDSTMARPKTIHLTWLGLELFRLLLGPSGLN